MQRMQDTGLRLFYTQGYFNTSVDDVLKELQMSKGAFYYHFDSKEDFFVQIIQTNLTHRMYASLIDPIKSHENPLVRIVKCLEDNLETAVHNELDFGCLLGNFIAEFNGRNETIMKHLNDILAIWEVSLVTALQKGKFNGHLDRHVDCEAVSLYIISSYLGIRTLMVGTAPSAKKYRFMSQLKHYFKSLEARPITA